MLKLSTPLSRISIISPRSQKGLERLGLKTAGDLLFHFPSRYEDFSKIYKIIDLEPGQQATIQGIIAKVNIRKSWRRKMVIVEAIIRDDTGTIRAVWFNQPYLRNSLRQGRVMNFSGKVSLSDGELQFSHPDHELADDKLKETRHTGRLVPIYPETRGLSSRFLRFIIQPILKNIEQITEFIPKEILGFENLPEINESIQKIHFPETLEEVDKIKRRFSFENLFLLQLFNLRQKNQLSNEKAPIITRNDNFIENIKAHLPFILTKSQSRSLNEVFSDLQKSQPMNRLIQGDVGSGKTIVAALAALFVTRDGYQASFMAPTEILANQHFTTLKNLFTKIENKIPGFEPPLIGLITSSGAKLFLSGGLETELKKAEIQKKINSGEIKIIIGTHSLIQKSIGFKNLALAIVDEQHRFGVRQRLDLVRSKRPVPHFLSMSATPIPRTLMLAIFGDLDISIIDELPEGRKAIITKVVAPENRKKAYGFTLGQIEKGRQAFVICPRIEIPSEEKSPTGSALFKKLEIKSVKEEYEKLSKKIFPNLKVEMLHGQMKSKYKNEIMKRFGEGEIDILVSTSVVEVGVDVPNATIMIIEGSDRFGLAQLYQFRGRVGRGEHQSFCLLFSDSESQSTQARLKAITEAKNGFELAERDLKLRGPGQFLGSSQTGLPDIAMESLQDPTLIKSSRDAAASILKRDNNLKKYPPLREKLEEFQERIHRE